MAKRFYAARRESVWLNGDARKAPELEAVNASAFGLWWRLLYLVDDEHVTPDLATIARDGGLSVHEMAKRIGELVTAGLVYPLRGDRFQMTDLSRRFYTLTWEEAQARDDNE